MHPLWWIGALWAWLGVARADEGPWVGPILQLKPRVEAVTKRDGDPRTGVGGQAIQRARWGVATGMGPVRAKLVLQDVRLAGDFYETSWEASRAGFGLSHGWVEVAPWRGVRWRVGRQEVALHGERLVARAAWSPEGQRFDGMRLGAYHDGWGAEFMAFRVPPDPWWRSPWDGDPVGGSLVVARGGLDRTDRVSEGVALVESDPARGLHRATLGAFSEGQEGALRWRAEGYAQVGASAGRQVRAWMASAEVGWQGQGWGRPAVGVGYDFLSGDRAPRDGVFTRFDTLYGADHRYYGTADIAWRVRGGEADDRGLHDARVRATLAPSSRWSLRVDGHAFALPVAREGRRWLGLEADLVARWRPDPALGLSAGAMVFGPLDGGGRSADGMLWVQMDLSVGDLRVPLGGR